MIFTDYLYNYTQTCKGDNTLPSVIPIIKATLRVCQVYSLCILVISVPLCILNCELYLKLCYHQEQIQIHQMYYN